jgi:ABC-2 type transport system ATP-binding protein
VQVLDVTKTYPGGAQALRGVSFTLPRGERTCLLGPNGAGKTTLIRLLTGGLRPTTGAVRVLGAGTDEAGFLAAKRRVGIVPQGPGMYRDVTVSEYLRLVERLYGGGDRAGVVEAFGLGPLLGRRMAELSGGWQRRLVLAAAVLPGPELLLLDEPTVGLDPLAVRDVHAFLRPMMRGRTVLLCTHNLEEAEALCDAAVILRGGRVLVHARLESLRARAGRAVLLQATEGPARLLAALAALGVQGAAQEAGGDGAGAGGAVRVPLLRAEAEVPALLKGLLDAGLHVYQARLVTARLEELFVDIVGGADAPAAAGT